MHHRIRKPREPQPGECCGSGCTRCVWDVYYDELATFEDERRRLAELGVGTDSDLDIVTSSSESGDDSVEGNRYIGSVVVKELPTPSLANIDAATSSILRGIREKYSSIDNVEVVRCSANVENEEQRVLTVPVSPICVVNLTLSQSAEGNPHIVPPVPGDVVEILAPNDVIEAGVDPVAQLCELLQLDPEQWLELHRSPFVPDGHFPPWLPLRQAMTVRHLLTHFVDISSCSYLLNPTFFESLLRIYKNSKCRPIDDEGDTLRGTPELLEECASYDSGPQLFRTLLNGGKPLCFPCLVDVLSVFPFVKLPLARLLEIAGPLQARKFSVAGHYMQPCAITGKDVLQRVELCLRHVVAARPEGVPKDTPASASAYRMAQLLNDAALRRAKAGDGHGLLFRGHVSSLLCERAVHSHGSSHPTVLHPPRNSTMYLSSSLFNTSVFSSQIQKALTMATRPGVPLSGSIPLILVGAGTGIAPLMGAVRELVHLRQCAAASSSAPSYPCWVIYGARCFQELVYHDDMMCAQRLGALSQYDIAVSRERNIVEVAGRHVTDIIIKNAEQVKNCLTTLEGHMFVCGPTSMLQSVRQLLGNRILCEPDDDSSVQEHRLLRLEQEGHLCFDMWCKYNIFR